MAFDDVVAAAKRIGRRVAKVRAAESSVGVEAAAAVIMVSSGGRDGGRVVAPWQSAAKLRRRTVVCKTDEPINYTICINKRKVNAHANLEHIKSFQFNIEHISNGHICLTNV